MVTKQQSPSKASDFQTPQFCTDEICKANVMNHNEDPLLFPHQAYAADENLKPRITATRSNTAEREIVLQYLQITTNLSPIDTIQVYDIYQPGTNRAHMHNFGTMYLPFDLLFFPRSLAPDSYEIAGPATKTGTK